MIQYIVLAVSFFVAIKWLLSEDPPPKNGIYTQPNKWYPFKWLIFRALIWLRKQRSKRQKTVTGEGAGYGMKSRSSPEDMDKAQKLPEEHPKAVDAVYFNGGNKEGMYFVAATARRHNNLVQTILLFRVPGVGIFQHPQIPDTNLQGTEPGCFAAAGMKLEVVEPMKTWRLTFKGKLKHVESQREVTGEFDLLWKAYTDFFDFDTDMSPVTMADGIAREKWTREYFDRLQKSHQTHYEQFGEITGKFKIESFGEFDVKVQGIRDHSYGNVRNWSDLHRYALNYAHLEDGTGLCVGAISMPSSLSRLTVGYVFHPDGKMDAVSSSEFEFYNFGDDGHPPEEMDFKFIAGNKLYELKLKVEACPVFYMGEDWDAKIYERFCTYTVNGKKGWGISEWEYRNRFGKQADQSQPMETAL